MSTVFLGGALVAAAVTLFILQPILSGRHASLVRAEDELTDTEARKRVTLLALRDVEYDFLAGKLDEEDYLSLKADFTAEALAALEADAAASKPHFLDDDVKAEITKIRAELGSELMCRSCGLGNGDGSHFGSEYGRNSRLGQLVDLRVRFCPPRS